MYTLDQPVSPCRNWMTRQAEELFCCFHCKFSPWGFAESVIPCEVKEGCSLQKAITNPVTGRQMAPGKKSPWCPTSKGDNKKGKGITASRNRVTQDIVMGKRGFKMQVQRIMQGTEEAKAALPMPLAHVGSPCCAWHM